MTNANVERVEQVPCGEDPRRVADASSIKTANRKCSCHPTLHREKRRRAIGVCSSPGPGFTSPQCAGRWHHHRHADHLLESVA
jgi:hypothetical protein